MQIELAHATQVRTLSELTNELNESLGAILLNCDASLRWLDRAEPDLSEALTSIRRVLADAHRAAETVVRVGKLATSAQTSSARRQD